MSGWGLSPWGLSPWGLGAPLSVAYAQAIADRVVRVGLTVAPLAGSPAMPGSALNPTTWTVQRLDTNELFTVINVEQVEPEVFDLSLLQPLASIDVLHSAGSETLIMADGTLIAPPTSADFYGMLALETDREAQLSALDVANPQSEYGDRVGGTLHVGSDGDYENDAGVALLRKLVTRRLMTLRGAFFHLQDYGQGLRLKEPLPVSDLVKLRAQLELAILREPEIRSVRTQVALLSDGQLIVQVRAVMEPTGQTLTATVDAAAPLIQ